MADNKPTTIPRTVSVWIFNLLHDQIGRSINCIDSSGRPTLVLQQKIGVSFKKASILFAISKVPSDMIALVDKSCRPTNFHNQSSFEITHNAIYLSCIQN